MLGLGICLISYFRILGFVGFWDVCIFGFCFLGFGDLWFKGNFLTTQNANTNF